MTFFEGNAFVEPSKCCMQPQVTSTIPWKEAVQIKHDMGYLKLWVPKIQQNFGNPNFGNPNFGIL